MLRVILWAWSQRGNLLEALNLPLRPSTEETRVLLPGYKAFSLTTSASSLLLIT
jgi:hypothetical protein